MADIKKDEKSAAGMSLDVFGVSAPELIKDLAGTVAHVGVKHYGLTPVIANKLGVDVALAFAEQAGGTQVYIPITLSVKISNRDLEMYKKFDGSNHNQLAKEFGCSVAWVYTVLKRVRKQMQDKNQPNLF
ncbi:Mor transcription activator family protein [Psychrobacter raelei]|uniref:Mor transcription activator family protein n=1 Tax=Psychrobacter raelei TaxID=2565531 RepID=A0AAT9PFP5_9GAMM|nr:Mor transcription activator family protein [Psychrobacter sp. PraFG1]UNK05817.1 hypothetical protein MN210_03260 [Psychrobacter sp. PraFG1]